MQRKIIRIRLVQIPDLRNQTLYPNIPKNRLSNWHAVPKTQSILFVITLKSSIQNGERLALIYTTIKKN